MVVVDTRKINKNVKCITDHHPKGTQVLSVKFCDWSEEKPHFNQGNDHSCKDCADVQKFMFISCDINGKVVQNILEDYKIYTRATENVLFDPVKNPSSNPL